jgi:hypothetical protein
MGMGMGMDIDMGMGMGMGMGLSNWQPPRLPPPLMSELNTLALPPGWGDPYMSHRMMHEEGRRRAGRDTAMDLSHPAGAAPWAPHFGSLAPQYAHRSKSPPPRRGPSHQLHPQQPQQSGTGGPWGKLPHAGPCGDLGVTTPLNMGPLNSPFGLSSSRNSQMDTATGYFARRWGDSCSPVAFACPPNPPTPTSKACAPHGCLLQG